MVIRKKSCWRLLIAFSASLFPLLGPFHIPAAFALVSDSITASAGTPQAANVGQPFAVALAARVTDASGNPVPGATVVFAAPAAGASGAFAGGATTATALANSSGVATAPAFTANNLPGNYSVTATVPGAAPAAFHLTNAAPGAPSLGGAIGGKSGPPNARVWVFQVGNNGPGSALSASITGIAFVQTHGTACTPAVKTPLPLAAGNIAPHTVATVSVTIDFTGCPSSAVFKVTAPESANGASGTIVRLNQFP